MPDATVDPTLLTVAFVARGRAPRRVGRRGRRRAAGWSSCRRCCSGFPTRVAGADPRDQQVQLDLRDDDQRGDLLPARPSGPAHRPADGRRRVRRVPSSARSSGCTSRRRRSTRSSSSARRRRRLHAAQARRSAERPRCAGAAHRHTVAAMLIGFVIGVYDGALGPGTGSFLVFALVGLMGYAFLEASAKAKIANFATNLGALVVFAPGGHIMVKVGAGHGREQPAGRLRRRPDGGARWAAGSCASSSSSSCPRSSCGSRCSFSASGHDMGWLQRTHREAAQDVVTGAPMVTAEPPARHLVLRVVDGAARAMGRRPSNAPDWWRRRRHGARRPLGRRSSSPSG